MKRCCHEFAKWFGKDTQAHFVAAVDLMGKYLERHRDDPDHEAYSRLVVMEEIAHTNIDDLPLPNGAEWKDQSFLSELFEALTTPFCRLFPIHDIGRDGSKKQMNISSPSCIRTIWQFADRQFKSV